MAFFKSLSNLISKPGATASPPPAGVDIANDPATGALPGTETGPESDREAVEAREIVQPPILRNSAAPQTDAGTGDGIRIKGEVQPGADTCKFMVSQPVLEGYSWSFQAPDEAKGSPLAEALYNLPFVLSVMFIDKNVMVTRTPDSTGSWEELGKEVGRVIREHLESGEPAIDMELLADVPHEQEIELKLNEIIEFEINPGVAGHSGYISLNQVKGNTVWITMGGGCQGCSAASETLKYGIVEAFRIAVPQLGAVLDETDHAAGENPYFS